MALDYTAYVSKLAIKPLPEMPKPPRDTETDPAKWVAYADDLTTYRQVYVDHVKSVKDWALDTAALLEKFKVDLLIAYGIDANPKAQTVFDLATAKAKSTMPEVEAKVAELAPLVK
jgi:hypothetical protein